MASLLSRGGPMPLPPFTVLGGYLGAGKTTLLNHLLAQAGGLRIAVLVNDFGSINIDGALVRAHAGDTIELANGCLCCSVGTEGLRNIHVNGVVFEGEPHLL